MIPASAKTRVRFAKISDRYSQSRQQPEALFFFTLHADLGLRGGSLSVSLERSRSLPLRFGFAGLSQPQAGASAVLVDELDTCSLQRISHHLKRSRSWLVAAGFELTNCDDTHASHFSSATRANKIWKNKCQNATPFLTGVLLPEFSALGNRGPAAPIFSLNLMHRGPCPLSAMVLVEQRNWLRFAKNVAGRFSPLRLWRFPKAYTGSALVLVDELDVDCFESRRTARSLTAVIEVSQSAASARRRPLRIY